jgi:hypothetical protein
MTCPPRLPHLFCGGINPPPFIAMKEAKTGTKVPPATKVAPQVITWDMVDEATDDLFTEDVTFNLAECKADGRLETRRSKTGNIGYRVTTDQGRVVTFWSSTRDLCLETDEDGNCSLLPGTTITDDGSLIPPGSKSSFWD